MARARTQAGVVEGVSVSGLEVFRGIPFARPPVGTLRFRPPAPVEPWSGVREARAFGPSSPQWGELPAFARRLIAAGPGGLSQDCLYLNVWTPACDGARRPVMVWIHGGAFTLGSGSTALYAGTRLAQRGDVVVVTLNYRLGALGFLNLRSLRPDQPEVPANLGLLDQIAALEWVRDNVEAFGGDPENVTIFGESAGGMSVGTLLGTPRATGLFHKAICQSGAAHNVTPPEYAALVAERFLEELGIGPDDLGALQGAQIGEIMRAQSAASIFFGPNTMPWQPSVDGDLLPRTAVESIRAGLNPKVPLLVGTNRDEWKLFTFGGFNMERLTEPELAQKIRRVLPGVDAAGRPLVERALEVYGPGGSRRGRQSASERWSSLMSDRIFHHPAAQLAHDRSQLGAPTYAYLFNYSPPLLRRRLGACHGLEIPFVFGTLRQRVLGVTLGAIPSARDVSRRMQDAWLAFARTGDPSHAGLPAWQRYGPNRRATMVFDTDCSTEVSRFEDVRRFWESIEPLAAPRAAGSARRGSRGRMAG
ncbi:MAG: carboxylesterase/lipase family protein [Myxococcota bacterium]|nr:carboxylesterase/lipase family protein [Myxococcota bacterium]